MHVPDQIGSRLYLGHHACVRLVIVIVMDLDVGPADRAQQIDPGKQQVDRSLESHGDDLSSIHVQQHEFPVAANGTAIDSSRLRYR